MDDWCRTWAMKLNVEKCNVMHLGISNPKAVYCMRDNSGNKRDIEKANLKRGLIEIVANDLKLSDHVDRIVGKENSMLKRKFESRTLSCGKSCMFR